MRSDSQECQSNNNSGMVIKTNDNCTMLTAARRIRLGEKSLPDDAKYYTCMLGTHLLPVRTVGSSIVG